MKRLQAMAHGLAQVVGLAMLVNLGAAMAGLPSTPAAASDQRPIKIIAFGDSLTAGYGVPASKAFPEQLALALKARGHNVVIENAGVSGDTTAAGLARLDWAVGEGADAVIVEFGANDMLRGLPPKTARKNLDTILTGLKAKNLDILLAGMVATRNYGEPYESNFNAIFPELAKAHGVLLYPFFLDGVALQEALNLDDGLHPNARGIGVIVERILPSVEKLIAQVSARRAAASKS